MKPADVVLLAGESVVRTTQEQMDRMFPERRLICADDQKGMRTFEPGGEFKPPTKLLLDIDVPGQEPLLVWYEYLHGFTPLPAPGDIIDVPRGSGDRWFEGWLEVTSRFFDFRNGRITLDCEAHR